MSKIMGLAVVAGLVTSCASNSGIVPLGNDAYMVSRQAASGFSGMGTLKADAIGEAARYCESNDKVFEAIETEESEPPYILGNFPRVELHFKCMPKP